MDSSEPAPHLLGAIRGELFNCSLDVDAAAAEARAQAIEESGLGWLRAGSVLRAAQWVAMAPQVCAYTAAAQERTVEDLAAVVAQYEVPWPWVRAAWGQSDVQFAEDLAAVCGDAAVFDLNLPYDVFNLEASRNPPPAACVREARILVSYSAVSADRDALVAPLLQVLARIWNRTTDDENWATVQAAFDEHWATVQAAFDGHLFGCRSARAATPEAVGEGVIADTMVSTAGGLTQYGSWYHYADERWLFEDCDADRVRIRGRGGGALAAAVEATLFQCPYDAEAAEAAWAATNPNGWTGTDYAWAQIARDVCDDGA